MNDGVGCRVGIGRMVEQNERMWIEKKDGEERSDIAKW